MASGVPEKIRVKLSSEDAGGVSLTSVVWREMTLRGLVELMLDVTGKDAARVGGLLRRGALVVGATRYRWEPMEVAAAEAESLLASLPDAEPQRPFAPERCVRVLLEGRGLRASFEKEVLSRRRMFRRETFWDTLAAQARVCGVRYAGYSYREQADRYVLDVAPGTEAELRTKATLLAYSALETQVRKGGLQRVEFLVRRTSE